MEKVLPVELVNLKHQVCLTNRLQSYKILPIGQDSYKFLQIYFYKDKIITTFIKLYKLFILYYF